MYNIQYNFTDGRTGAINHPSDHNSVRDERYEQWDERPPDRYIVYCRYNYRRRPFFGSMIKCCFKSYGDIIASSWPLLLRDARALLEKLESEYKTPGDIIQNIDSVIDMIKGA